MFFFQAEDGIRDLVRSRGLGDVYKRQETKKILAGMGQGVAEEPQAQVVIQNVNISNGMEPVSYTHLTLPTSDLV